LPTINTTKFGKVDYQESDIITFVRAILGFEDLRKYFIISLPESEPFRWLQSIEDPSVCFVLIEPTLVIDNYVAELSQHDIKQLEGRDVIADYKIFVIVTIPRGMPEEISVNLQGPIVMNVKNQKSIQMVLNNPEYAVRFNLFKDQKETVK
jgi:flagellar assembly factor FliW